MFTSAAYCFPFYTFAYLMEGEILVEVDGHNILIGPGQLLLVPENRSILIRHFTAERINDYNRITIGTREQMEAFLDGVRDCLEDQA